MNSRRVNEGANQWFFNKRLAEAQRAQRDEEALAELQRRLPGECEQCQHDNYSDHREDGEPVQKRCLICGEYCKEER